MARDDAGSEEIHGAPYFHQGAEASAIVAPGSEQLGPRSSNLRIHSPGCDAPISAQLRSTRRRASGADGITGCNWNSRRDVEKHYRTMTFESRGAASEGSRVSRRLPPVFLDQRATPTARV